MIACAPHRSDVFRSSACALLACYGLVAAPGSAQDPPILEVTTKSVFIDSKERISGGDTLGLVFVDEEDEAGPVPIDAAYVYLSAPLEPLELQLATVDGRYVATFESDPKTPGWSRIQLNLPADHVEFLSGYSLREVALLVKKRESGTVYFGAWGRPGRKDTVRLYINSENADSYYVLRGSAGSRTLRCQKASPKSSFKFDRICDLPASAVIDSKEVRIGRQRGADFLKDVKVVVAYDEP